LILFLICNLYLVDQPDIKTPDHGVFYTELRIGPEGEVLGFFGVELFQRCNLGVSCGSSNLIGVGSLKFYSPAVQLRIIILDQGFITPTVLAGFDNQGYGPETTEELKKRYLIMSKGLYVQAGKNFFNDMVDFCPSFGINYTIEGKKGLDIFMGTRTELGENLAFLTDYCAGFNDAQDKGYGYLNTGLRFIFYEELFLEFSLRDLLGNGELQFNRIVKIGYNQEL